MEIDQTNINTSNTKIHTPLHIFIKSNINYSGFCKAIQNTIGSNDYNCKNNLNKLKL